MSIALQEEKNLYDSLKEDWVSSGLAGKFVVIKGEEVFDMFNTYEDALKQGLKRYGNVPFFIKQIQRIEEVYHFFHGFCDQCPA